MPLLNRGSRREMWLKSTPRFRVAAAWRQPWSAKRIRQHPPIFCTTCCRVVFPLTSYVREEKEGNRGFMVLEHMFPLREWRKNNQSFRCIPKTFVSSCWKLEEASPSWSAMPTRRLGHKNKAFKTYLRPFYIELPMKCHCYHYPANATNLSKYLHWFARGEGSITG